MIILSTIEISHKFDVLFPLMGFWSTSLNAFVFPWGMLTLTLLNVAAIRGLPAGETEVHASLEFPTEGLFYKHDIVFKGYICEKLKAWLLSEGE